MRKISLILALIICFSFLSCKSKDSTTELEAPDPGCEMSVFALEGSVASVLRGLEANNGKQNNSYSVSISDIDDIMMNTVNGDFDCSVLPSYDAFFASGRTEGDALMLSVLRYAELIIAGANTEKSDIAELTEGTTVYAVSNSIDYWILDYIKGSAALTFAIEGVDSYSALEAMTGSEEECFLAFDRGASKSLSELEDIRTMADLNALWSEESGLGAEIPGEILLINRKFASANENAVTSLLDEYGKALSTADPLLVNRYGNSDLDKLIKLSEALYDHNSAATGGYRLSRDNIYTVN